MKEVGEDLVIIVSLGVGSDAGFGGFALQRSAQTSHLKALASTGAPLMAKLLQDASDICVRLIHAIF